MAHENLKPREAKFVEHRLSGMGKRDAAIAAGYKEAGAGVTASRLLSRGRVLEALLEGSRKKLSDGAVSAVDMLEWLMANAKSEQVKLESAKALLAHGGLAAVRQTEHRHVIEDNRSLPELRAHAAMLIAKLGLDRNAPLPPIVDVEPMALPAPAHDPFADA